MATLTTKTGRSKLKVQREPHWLKIGAGAFIGFRRGPDTWIVRYRDRAGKQHYQSLGQHEEFTEAKARAERWLAQATSGAHRAPSRGTVRSALAAYLRHLRSLGRRRAAREIAPRFRLIVPKRDAFGVMKLEDVTRQDVESWRDRLRPGREPRSINRHVRAVVAGLNCAVERRGFIGRKEAWALEHLADDGDVDTAVFLTAEQRDRLIAAAPKPLAALMRGWAETGARPSELAETTVADFNQAADSITLRHKKGRGSKVRIRAVQLSLSGAEFFKAQAKGKLPLAPLFATAEGGHWTTQQWSRGIRTAIVAANKKAKKPAQRIPAGVSAYSFRHTRISELLQVYGVDPLTVAQQTGTSIGMVEKSYFKFIATSMRAKLDAVRAAQ